MDSASWENQDRGRLLPVRSAVVYSKLGDQIGQPVFVPAIVPRTGALQKSRVLSANAVVCYSDDMVEDTKLSFARVNVTSKANLESQQPKDTFSLTTNNVVRELMDAFLNIVWSWRNILVAS